MSDFLHGFFEFCETLGGDILWGPWTFFGLLGAGLLFTVWTKFNQYRSMTHGIQVVRGVYDDPDDPGAINHFQALSAALSATVGLGNIGGVALAIGAGGPGAMVWMWLTGVFGMALKTVEITLSQMYRNIDDPDNPHGGAMWVVEKGRRLERRVVESPSAGLSPSSSASPCSSAPSPAATCSSRGTSPNSPRPTGASTPSPPASSLALLVGLVIIGGIKRIGSVAGKLVPVHVRAVRAAALAVLAMHITEIPASSPSSSRARSRPPKRRRLPRRHGMGWAFSQGLRRALFSNEAGQGSAPIAHAAAKTDEPAREGIVGGIGPFIDTLCICTLTGLVILSTNTWNRAPLMTFDAPPTVCDALAFEDSPLVDPTEEAEPGLAVYLNVTPPAAAEGVPASATRLNGVIAENESGQRVVAWDTYNAFDPPKPVSTDVMTHGALEREDFAVGAIAALPLLHPRRR
jgi:AGCS family alanine or glycine:cation symporter